MTTIKENKKNIDDLYNLFNKHEQNDQLMFINLQSELKALKYLGYYLSVFITGSTIYTGGIL